ncbi:MAG: hypothetical protein AB1489_43125, partial [Acidobacteriota bacterium]
KVKTICSVLILFLLLPSLSFSQTINKVEQLSGHLYQIGSQQKIPLYRWEILLSRDRWVTRYYELNGQLAAEDEMILENTKVKSYNYVRYSINEKAHLNINNNNLEYTQNLNGKSRTSIKQKEPNFLTGPMIIPFIWSRWKDLVAGKTITINYGVLDQLRSFNFDLSMDKTYPASKQDTVVIKMRASSFIVRFFVDPIYLVFSKSDRVFLKGIGRTLIVVKKGNRLKPIDAELVIENGSYTNIPFIQIP